MVDSVIPTDHNILVIMSGGTIDSEKYDSTPDRVTPLAKSIIPQTVREIQDEMGIGEQCDFFEWIMKDSQDFEKGEIDALAEIIKTDERQQYIVTHGTDAMVKNAKALKKALEGTGKTVFFVGAMEPLTHGKESDGQPNLKFALEHIKGVAENDPGVYIIGRSKGTDGKFRPWKFDPDETIKNKDEKVFEMIRDGQNGGAPGQVASRQGGWAR